MRIERLILEDFRNFTRAELLPAPGVNVIYGNNAQGKTNLMEALYLLTGQRSFRSSRESDLVRFGQSQGTIEADFFAGGRSQNVRMVLGGGKKTVSLNELPVQPSELTGRYFAVVFSPTELSLVKEGPAQRRAFLDSAISQVMPRYLKTLAAMNRALSQRNTVLGDMGRFAGLEGMLEVWDRSFAKMAYSVIHARRRYIRRLSPKAAEVYKGISGGREELTVAYQCTIPGDWDAMTQQEGEQAVLEALAANRGEDLRLGFTGVGPHRDDMDLRIDGISARSFGSQGQQRSCALALKLAECGVIEEIAGERPIILLDDVLSELDKKRRDYFLSDIHGGQVFLTCCDSGSIRGVTRGMTIRVDRGELRSRRVTEGRAGGKKGKEESKDVPASGTGYSGENQ